MAAAIALPPAQAAASAPVAASYVPVERAMNLSAPRAMRYANGHLFVSSDNAVVVLTPAGTVVRTLTGMFGAAGMALSPDENTLYVALSTTSKIAVINTKTLAVRTRYTVAACPTYVAVGPHSLFYSYGCDFDEARIGQLNVAGKHIYGASQLFTAPPLLDVAGSTLVAGDPVGIPTTLTRYAIAGTSLTLGHESASVQAVVDLAASPDGRSVTNAPEAGTLVSRDPETLATTETLPPDGYGTAVAYSHDGKLLAAGFSGGLAIYDRASNSALLEGSVPVVGIGIGVLPGTVTFSDTDRRVYALDLQHGTTYLLTSTTSTPTPESLDLSVTSPTAISKPLLVTAEIPGLANADVTFVVEEYSGKLTTFVRRTNAHGVSILSTGVTVSGQAFASYAGDVQHLPVAQQAVDYRAPSAVTTRLSAGYAIRDGIVYFTSVADVHASAQILPIVDYDGYVTATLQQDQAGTWTTVSSSEPLVMSSSGRVSVWLKQADLHAKYRYSFVYSGARLSDGSSALTSTFVIG